LVASGRTVPAIPKTHTPIRALVRRIRRETGRSVPDIDPNAPGIDAQVLVILSDPGELGALRTRILSPLANNDQTAKNQRQLFTEARLDPAICVFWNAVPCEIARNSKGRARRPNQSEKERGAAYLGELLSFFKPQPVVVACGKDAADACDKIDLTAAIKVCHPAMQGQNRYPENRGNHVKGLRLAAARAGRRRKSRSAP
jgi:hypothetical protein